MGDWLDFSVGFACGLMVGFSACRTFRELMIAAKRDDRMSDRSDFTIGFFGGLVLGLFVVALLLAVWMVTFPESVLWQAIKASIIWILLT